MAHHGVEGWKPQFAEDDEEEEDYQSTYNPQTAVEEDPAHERDLPRSAQRPLLPAFSFHPSTEQQQADSEPSSARPSTSARESLLDSSDTDASIVPRTSRHSHRRSSSVTQISNTEMPRREFPPPPLSPIETARLPIPSSPHRRNNRLEISINETAGGGMIDLDAALPSPDTPRSRGRSWSAARQSMHSRGHASITRYDMSDVFEEDEDADTVPSSPEGPMSPPMTKSLPDLTKIAATNTLGPSGNPTALNEPSNGTTRRHSATDAEEKGLAKTKVQKQRKRLHHKLLKFLRLRRK